ncbi:DNA (cytosine-5-)-methyltransferase [Rurimicrobium arvi]|uniref:DNA (cytosine-5-)-methyltransferase n=1 Tax=Rurimicrobium arvi TaxID=2049916 RepID=UPI0031DCA850
MERLSKEIIYLDLFSGIGGFAEGLRQADFVFKQHFFSEIDVHAAANYQYHFKDASNVGDITKFSGKEIPAPDVITFGSPCQDLSLAGKRKGLRGKRSGLFFEALRIIRTCLPRVFVFENVKGIFSSNGGKDFEAILRAFAELGVYDLQWQLVNSAWFLPQNRERLYLVGHLRKSARTKVFPIGEGKGLPGQVFSTGKGRRENIVSALTSTYSKGVHGRGETYIKQKGSRLRRLTPLECERLQGFSDQWTQYGLYEGERREIADTHRYHMLGNAVSVAPVKEIARRLLGKDFSLGQIQSAMIYEQKPEIVLGNATEVNIPELNVTYSRTGRPFLGHIGSSDDVSRFLRSTFQEGEVELHECFVVLYLNTAHDIIGYYCHTKGGIAATLTDVRIILSVAVKALATAIIIAHNHPSGSTRPSEQDRVITQKIKEACSSLDIMLLDHLIITSTDYFSFADNGMAGLEVAMGSPRDRFVEAVKQGLITGQRNTKVTLEHLALQFNIKDKNEVKEYTELAIVERARSIAHDPGLEVHDRFRSIVSLYEHQVNLSHRTSQSILLQQYSTPAPIGYLMGVFCRIDQLHLSGGYAFEPSAGNGLLTIAARPERVYVNEIDPLRRSNLRAQGYANVGERDAALPFTDMAGRFMAVLTNPPFGVLDAKVQFNGYAIRSLEHVMAIYALNCMAQVGKAAIIVGGHTTWDPKGRISAGRNRIFLNYLYHHYHVADVIQVDGKKLYSRQGTSFNTRLILINGRKHQPEGAAPVYDAQRDSVVRSFDQLYERVIAAMEDMPDDPKLKGYRHTVKRYEKYLKLSGQHPQTLLLYRHGDNYEAYGDYALWVTANTKLKLSKEFLYEGKAIPVVSVPSAQLEMLGSLMKRKRIGLALADELLSPEQVKKEHMNNKAKTILAALRNRTLGDPEGFELTTLPPRSGLSALEPDEVFNVNYDRLFEEFESRKASAAGQLYLFATPGIFIAFNEDAEIMAAVCAIRMIKVVRAGKFRYFLAASSRPLLQARVAKLKEAGHQPVLVEDAYPPDNGVQEPGTREISKMLDSFDKEPTDDGIGAPYNPTSNACVVLETQVPDSMAFETHEALAQIKEEVGGDVDNFVRDRLGYATKTALCKALSAEQTDAVMMAIYNIEARGQGMIIGDQTGIGKGRVAAAMIRYGCQQGLKPVFLTERANLFSDIYRDLYAIGSGRLRPFIVNARDSKTDIKDEEGEVIYEALPYQEQSDIFKSRSVPASFDFVVATYSQFNSPEKKPEKPSFLLDIAEDNIFILDEAHNSSGSSNTGNLMQGVVSKTRGVVFLSATFAKRPDNMPIYAMKTSIADCNMSREELVESIQRGGVALQEVLSSQLVAEGQMLRRERSFEGVEVNYITLTDKAEEHSAIADNITGIIRDIIRFQKDFINVVVEELDDIAVAEGKQVDLREGTSQAGVDNTPYFSKVFNIINQMLFSIKASSVAEKAIERLREGKKPIIAFSSTMGRFLEDMDDERGLSVSDGSMINPDFSEVLRRGLDGVMRYTERDIDGQPEYKKFEISELSPEAQQEYLRIQKNIEQIATGITLSPIDVVVSKIKEAGYSVAEVTGRKYELQLQTAHPEATGIPMALVRSRKKVNTNDAFRQFNNNEIDVLLINQSGSTGASAHAIITPKVPREQVKQRVMIVLQAELDINTEVQKRGRINRTGQIIKPIYDYVTSAIPAEMRLMMMLQKKLKSLDANTASNQKQSTKILDVPDFLNKYGDKVIKEYLLENPTVNKLLDDPLKLKDKTDSDQGEAEVMENAAHKVSGRVAVLSVKMQQEFYSEITERYNDYVSYLQQMGEYDLELEAMNLEAETINSRVVKMGSGSGSVFSEDSILETVQANVLKKPFTVVELENLIKESLQGQDARAAQAELIADYSEETGMALEIEEQEIKDRFDEMDRRIYTEKKFQRLKTDQQREEYISKRENEIAEGRIKALKQVREKAESRKFYLQKIFNFYYVGRNLHYPVHSDNGFKDYVPAVFLGFMVDWKRKNPFLPSKIKLRFALANSSKYLAIPASYDDAELIIGASATLPELPIEETYQNWGSYIQNNTVDRKVRHIVTGNLLQAFSDFKGKLVNYTTLDGKIRKGILLPDNWAADEQAGDKVAIPVIKALSFIKSLVIGKAITTNTGIGFLREAQGYKIIVSQARKAAGEIYLDKDLLQLVVGENFNKVSDKMVAIVEQSNITRFVEVIQDKHNCSVIISRYQFNSMEREQSGRRNRKPIRLPAPEDQGADQARRLELLSLQAMAIKLKLRLKLRAAA